LIEITPQETGKKNQILGHSETKTKLDLLQNSIYNQTKLRLKVVAGSNFAKK
jgi:hypothetical protein